MARAHAASAGISLSPASSRRPPSSPPSPLAPLAPSEFLSCSVNSQHLGFRYRERGGLGSPPRAYHTAPTLGGIAARPAPLSRTRVSIRQRSGKNLAQRATR